MSFSVWALVIGTLLITMALAGFVPPAENEGDSDEGEQAGGRRSA